jgi:hypothetical protein
MSYSVTYSGNGGGGTYAIKVAGTEVINFGAGANFSDTATVVVGGQTLVTSASNIKLYKSFTPTPEHNIDEILISDLELVVLSIADGVSFTIKAFSNIGKLNGTYNIRYEY